MQESEQSRLLSLKARLHDGRNGNVFELNLVGGSEHWYCNVCRCPIMGRVYHHETGRRHKHQMSVHGNGEPQQPNGEKPGAGEKQQVMEIAPGEPVPPGFEGEITKEADMQEALDSYRAGALVGVEYTLEIQDYDANKEPSYLCSLCQKYGDPRTIVAHLASYNHIRRVSVY